MNNSPQIGDSSYIDNNILTQGADGAHTPAAGILTKGAGAYGYFFGSDPICNYALRSGNSCYLHITQKVAPSVW